ncbi:MAG: SulP family inorganic anion transporter [Candidatus Melainabacteria bacterium]
MWAAAEAWQAGLFRPGHWLKNILSGCIVGVVALPLAMAFAIASGLKPEQGLYTAIIAGLVVSLMGGSRVQIAGPTGAFIVIVAGIVAHYGVNGLLVATVMAGVILLALGLMRFGAFIKFISEPVIVGFTSGIGVLIWVSQCGAFLGLPRVSGIHFHEKILRLGQLLPQFHPVTLGLALFSLALLVAAPKIRGLRAIPTPLLVLIIGTLLQAWFQFDGVATIGSTFGGIPQGLPHFQPPVFHAGQMILLAGPAFTIALLGAIESLLSAVVADGMAGTRHDSNQELIGQGLANILTPFFGGFTATGAIARTATNIRYGGNSPLSGVVHSLVLIFVLMFLAPVASSVPLCTLAAILFVVAWNMADIPHFLRILRYAHRSDIFTLLVTFLLTVLTDLVVAVNVGMVLSMLGLLGRMSDTAEFRTISGDQLSEKLRLNDVREIPDGLVVFSIQGPLFFGAVDQFLHALQRTHTRPSVLLFRMGHVPFLDISGLQALHRSVADLQAEGVTVLISEANAWVYRKLERIGILKMVGPDGYFADFQSALAQANRSVCSEFTAGKATDGH